MKELTGDIWSYYGVGSWICITTNGFVKNNNCAVMGAGVAKQAAQRFPNLTKIVGDGIKKYGNQPLILRDLWLITYPVKHHWAEEADIELIKQSSEILHEALFSDDALIPRQKVYTVRPGCGNGKLSWDDVKPVLEEIFTPPEWYEKERFFVVNK